jgi:shikimate kinase
MGAGKTTVGKRLGRRLGWKFTDLDEVVVEQAGKTISAIFASEGEAGFRKRESEALLKILQDTKKQSKVVALGGGAFVQKNNFAAIRDSGCRTIHLDADFETLLARCRGEAKIRPLLTNENQFRQLYEARRSGYMKADYRIDTTGKTVGEIVNEIMLQLGFNDELSKKSRTR